MGMMRTGNTNIGVTPMLLFATCGYDENRKHQRKDYSYNAVQTVQKATKLTASIYCNYNR